MVKLSVFRPGGQFGYGCKVWIASEMERKHLGGNHWFWFSRQLHPLPPTGPSSNPLDLYRTIDVAVNRRRARALKKTVRKANLNMFRPQIWRIDVAGFPASRFEAGQPGWDEQLIEDLQAGEFEVIVE